VKFVLSRLSAIYLPPALFFAGFFIILLPTPVHAAPLTVSSIVSLTNADREERGLRTLREDSLLSLAAQKKANDMAARGYFSHLGPDGRPPWKWLNLVGYYYTSAGENLGINFTDAKALERAWMRSPNHKANIISQKYTRVGIGIAKGMYNGKLTTFIVQFFARPAVFASTLSLPRS
jgi:uncharacterized protein YkwD